MAVSKLALLESRVTNLEAEITQLRTQTVTNGAQPEDWVDQIYGLFADYPDFDKVVELGKKYRESLRPKPARKRNPKAAKRRNL